MLICKIMSNFTDFPILDMEYLYPSCLPVITFDFDLQYLLNATQTLYSRRRHWNGVILLAVVLILLNNSYLKKNSPHHLPHWCMHTMQVSWLTWRGELLREIFEHLLTSNIRHRAKEYHGPYKPRVPQYHPFICWKLADAVSKHHIIPVVLQHKVFLVWWELHPTPNFLTAPHKSLQV